MGFEPADQSVGAIAVEAFACHIINAWTVKIQLDA